MEIVQPGVEEPVTYAHVAEHQTGQHEQEQGGVASRCPNPGKKRPPVYPEEDTKETRCAQRRGAREGWRIIAHKYTSTEAHPGVPRKSGAEFLFRNFAGCR